MTSLITFGCSWTYGVGSHYINGMEKNEFMDNAWYKDTCNSNSFRGLISKKFNYKNINFSVGGSSNQEQFHKAQDFFPSVPNNDDIIVLWGITSLYRYEFYDSVEKKWRSYFLNDANSASKIILKKHFDENAEIERLEKQIIFFNDYFKNKGITNYWFNTFNYHLFQKQIKNLLFDGKDLLSILINDFEPNDQYHLSTWYDPDRKIQKAKELGLVNPFTLHPTQQAHQILADVFEKELKLK